MRLTTDALIIRENNNIGEADRFVTALTRELGLVRASARGARNLKSRRASATQLLSYSRLTLYRGREKYIIDEAEPLQMFFELRSDIDKLALAQYFCELTGALAPAEEPAGDFLRLLLNGLAYLENGKRAAQLIKAVVELRMLALAGYMPALTACHVCGRTEDDTMWLSPIAGNLTCSACRPPAGSIALPPNLLAAMRHIVYAPADKVFAFTMPEASLAALADAAERFLLAQLQRDFKTLAFYHSLSQTGFSAQ